jgi:enoyl-[acyl-carrier protein] reductase I
LDINDPDHVEALTTDLTDRWGKIDGALHAIAFAPMDALGGNFLNTPAESAQTAFVTSAFSYKTLAVALLPLMKEAGGGALVTLDFDNTQAWPAYDWMGVAKSALESVTRYLARDLGPFNIRANAVSAGPLNTVAAKSIPGFERFDELWKKRSPLVWDATDPDPVARMVVVLLSDWATMTTGEMVHVDGGLNAVSAGADGD